MGAMMARTEGGVLVFIAVAVVLTAIVIWLALLIVEHFDLDTIDDFERSQRALARASRKANR